jgi:hypothetical protein
MVEAQASARGPLADAWGFQHALLYLRHRVRNLTARITYSNRAIRGQGKCEHEFALYCRKPSGSDSL